MSVTDEILAPANWEFTSPKEKLFSGDHVIDAYFKGKNDGLEQQHRLMLEKLVGNIKKAGEHTTEILSFLKKKKLNPISAYLRINSWDDFSILLVLPEKEFLDKMMLKAYEYISELESKVDEDMYHIQVSICDAEDKVDENFIRSDGFTFKHKGGK